MKTLIFEGAGWERAASNGVGNCRIRTRLKNKIGRIIYLEMGAHENTGFQNHVEHCFFDDVEEDRTNNRSKELVHLEGKTIGYPYTKTGILNFVNEKLECDFETMEVLNDNSVRVHETKSALC